jgi:hypothetical protein
MGIHEKGRRANCLRASGIGPVEIVEAMDKQPHVRALAAGAFTARVECRSRGA